MESVCQHCHRLVVRDRGEFLSQSERLSTASTKEASSDLRSSAGPRLTGAGICDRFLQVVDDLPTTDDRQRMPEDIFLAELFEDSTEANFEDILPFVSSPLEPIHRTSSGRPRSK